MVVDEWVEMIVNEPDSRSGKPDNRGYGTTTCNDGYHNCTGHGDCYDAYNGFSHNAYRGDYNYHRCVQ